MNGLQSIRVVIENDCAFTGNVLPLLHEIRHALGRLSQSGEITTIDLTTIPMSTTEAEQLDKLLGRGEITAQLNALGESHIWETRVPGVWCVTHYSQTGDLIGRLLEIGSVPDILKTQPEALADADTEIFELIRQCSE